MQDKSNEIVIFFLVTTVFILILVVFILGFLYLYEKKHAAFQENIANLIATHEKSLLRTQLEIQEQTLQNVSREIHDNIGLILTLAKLDLNTLPNELDNANEKKILAAISRISDAIADLRNLSKSLNSDYITQHGFVKALDREISTLKEIGKYHIDYFFEGTSVYMDAKKEVLIFRIIQEALNNILKHANGTIIAIGVCYRKDYLHLSIKDDGVGFISENMHYRSSGLNNMQQRAKMLNGICNISSAPNKGTSINVQIPY